MSDKKLLVLFTRLKGTDEWEDVWGFPKEHVLSVISRGEFRTFGENDIPDLSEEVNADVWIIHGQSYRLETAERIDAGLNKIDWKQQKALIRVHFGQASRKQFQAEIAANPYENTKELLKTAYDYGIGDEPKDDHPFVKFARLLRQPFNETEYNKSLKALTTRTPLHMRIANTMHHLSYVLHPLDIDVQGLIATDFTLEYWQEVVEDYKRDKALGKIDRTRDLIYSTALSGDDAVERVLAEAEQRFGKEGPWMTSWEELQQRYFPKDEAPANVTQILTLLQNDSQTNLDRFKTYFKEKNPIHEWVTNINRTLSEIRDALSKREQGLDGEKEKELRKGS
jgi:hypothetical protein